MTATNRPVAETAEGPVQGISADGVDIFRAIPYAAPPTGDRRWSPPEPAEKRGGLFDAGTRGAAPIQPPSRLAHVMGELDFAQSEDCLTLTVNRPSAPGDRRPVLVWLHGGAFSSGGGDLTWYSGEPLARNGDMVVVGVNYRLGALGFLRHPAIGPGNLGLRDQIQALEWIRENIASFGGDPDNVTLCGQSAGAWSIALHLANDRAGALFHRAILQSGPFGTAPQTEEQASRVADRFVEELGLDAGQADLAARARAKPAAEILAAQRATAAWYAETTPRDGSPAIAFQPVTDGEIVPAAEGYRDAIFRGAERMDTIVGFTRNELTAFGAALEPWREDRLFAVPTVEWAEQGGAAGRTVYLYRFDWTAPNSEVGACHCIELPFMFDTRTAYDPNCLMLKDGDPAEIDALASAMVSAWAAFARSGDLGGSSLSGWPRLAPGRGEGFILDATCRVAPSDSLAKQN